MDPFCLTALKILVHETKAAADGVKHNRAQCQGLAEDVALLVDIAASIPPVTLKLDRIRHIVDGLSETLRSALDICENYSKKNYLKRLSSTTGGCGGVAVWRCGVVAVWRTPTAKKKIAIRPSLTHARTERAWPPITGPTWLVQNPRYAGAMGLLARARERKVAKRRKTDAAPCASVRRRRRWVCE